MIRVAIVGAGCAGLGAARTLLEKGQGQIEVVLIDAFARLGGRAWTDSQCGFAFDKGPQYIQDPDVNPWTKIAADLNLTLETPDIDYKFRVLDAGCWQDKYSIKGVTSVADQLSQSFDTARAAFEADEPNSNLPMMAWPQSVDANLKLASASCSLGAVGESVEPWQYVARDNARQTIVDNGGDNKYVKEGLGFLVDKFGRKLQERFPKLLKIEFATKVTKIEERRKDDRIDVTSHGRRVCKANYCIVTVPCSEIENIIFEPNFSNERWIANGYIKLGSYKKVAFVPQAMPDDIALNTEYFMYDEKSDGCWQYFRLPTATNALIGVAVGDFARRLDLADDDQAAAAAFVNALNTAYPSPNPPAPSVIPSAKPLVTNWTNQQHIGGAYSYTRYDGLSSADPTAFAARVKISEPHADGRVRFAGEATWTQAYGTIHGAYFSGEREANHILVALGLA